MPGFNYGGHGDGTGWSSESGSGPEPGGGSHGNSGGQSGGHGGNNSVDQQISAIQNDPKIKQKLTDMWLAARKINPAAKMTLGSISPSGMMQVSIDGITADQARQIGLGGLIIGFNAIGYIGAVGEIDTGHRLNQSGASIPGSETTIDGFMNGQKPAGGWHAVAKDSWTGAGPVNAGLVNNAIKSARIIRKGYVTGVLTPEEVMNKAEYKAMRQAFDSLPLAKQGEAVRQIVAAWSLAWQDFPVNLKKDMGRVTERIVDAINLALVLNQTSSKMVASQKDVDVANQVINETVKAINDVNKKIAEKQKQQAPLMSLMQKKQKEIEDLKKVFKNHSYHGIRDAQREYDDARNKYTQLQSDINALNAQISGLTARKQQAERNKAAAEAKKKEDDAVKDAVKFTADFYKEVFKVYGEKAEQLAKLLADQAKGKKVRNVEDALRAYEKHKANINKKINAKDREAIAKALESVDVKQAAKNISRFGKGLGYTSLAIDAAEWAGALKEAIETDNWRQFFVKTETIAAGMAASAVTGFAFSIILGGPVGLLGYGLIMAGIGALIDDKAIEEVNKFIGV